MMMSLLRCLPAALDEQRATRGWPMEPLRARSRRLAGDTILFLGYGSIARAMVQRLRPFGPRMIGYRRRARGDEEIDIVEEDTLAGALAAADHVVDLLPESASTRGFVDAVRIRGMKCGARFYNVGRGATVDQRALATALRDGHLDAARCSMRLRPRPLAARGIHSGPRRAPLRLAAHRRGHADEALRTSASTSSQTSPPVEDRSALHAIASCSLASRPAHFLGDQSRTWTAKSAR